MYHIYGVEKAQISNGFRTFYPSVRQKVQKRKPTVAGGLLIF
jgi:hypothetical protein